MEVVTEGIGRQTARHLVGQGWAGLLNELYDRLPESVVISDVKEKFGTLRVYYWATVPTPDVDVESLVSQIEDKSGMICEQCGKPGHLREGAWLKTLCDECAKKRQRGAWRC